MEVARHLHTCRALQRRTGDQPRRSTSLAVGVSRGDRYQTLLGVTGSARPSPWPTSSRGWPADPDHLATTRRWRRSSTASWSSSRTTPSGTSSPTTTTTSPRPTSATDTLHREGRLDQRGHRPAAARGHQRPPDPPRRGHRGPVSAASTASARPRTTWPEHRAPRGGRRRHRDEVIRKLVDIQYQRNDFELSGASSGCAATRSTSSPRPRKALPRRALRRRGRGDPRVDPVTARSRERSRVAFFPAPHFVTSAPSSAALVEIEQELEERLAELDAQGKLLEAQRLRMRTKLRPRDAARDGLLHRHRELLPPPAGKERRRDARLPARLLPRRLPHGRRRDPRDLPQIGGMYKGDRSRKQTLVDFGFRLPQRPRQPAAALRRVRAPWSPQILYVSATPAEFELARACDVVEQVIRPTGLVDPRSWCGRREPGRRPAGRDPAPGRRGERVLVTTLTKRMAEDLTDYLRRERLRVRYLHSEVEALERMQIVRELRLGEFDVLVGINLLREGLDLPEVALVAILDADKEGFLRGQTSLIQTIGRAARNVRRHGDHVRRPRDRAMRALDETERRRTRRWPTMRSTASPRAASSRRSATSPR